MILIKFYLSQPCSFPVVRRSGVIILTPADFFLIHIKFWAHLSGLLVSDCRFCEPKLAEARLLRVFYKGLFTNYLMICSRKIMFGQEKKK